MIKAHLQHLWYVVRHKWFVLLEGRKLGLGWWQLLIHDLSKFSLAEWGAYTRFFFGDGVATTKTGGPPRKATPEFAAAWKHHWMYNPHHWEYWLDHGEFILVQGDEMPDKYRREMLADWRGAGRARGMPDTLAWYISQRDKIVLHPETQAWIEAELGFDSAVISTTWDIDDGMPIPGGGTMRSPTWDVKAGEIKVE